MLNNEIRNEDKFYINPNNPDPIFDISYAGISYPNPFYIKRRDVPLNFYVFEYVIRGRGFISGDYGTYNIDEGDLYIINTKYPQYYYADRNNPFEKIWINSSGLLLDQLAPVYGFDKAFSIKKSGHEIYDLFVRIHKILRDSTLSRIEAFNRVSLILHEIMIYMKSTNIIENQPINTMAVAIKSYLDRNIYSNITISNISKTYYISPNHIIRIFKSAYGTTPKQYLLNKKIETSEKLLSMTDMKIEDIAMMLKFNSVQHFSAAYKKLRGITPNRYRNL